MRERPDQPIDYERRWETAGIPEPHRGQTLAEWETPDAVTSQALFAASAFVDTFPERYRRTTTRADRKLIGQGMAIFGNPGTGKSTLSCMIAQEIHRRYDRTILYYRAQTLLDHYYQVVVKGKGEPWMEKRLARAGTAHYLLLDDVGKEYRKSDSGFVGTVINGLLRDRHESGLPTGVNSNVPLEQWGVLYDKALPSFAYEAFVLVNLTGKDFRRAER